MTYLESLYARRDALLAAAQSGAPASGLSSYGLDGETWAVDLSLEDRLLALEELIRREENKSGSASCIYVVPRRGPWLLSR